jgi:hypothetical protein
MVGGGGNIGVVVVGVMVMVVVMTAATAVVGEQPLPYPSGSSYEELSTAPRRHLPASADESPPSTQELIRLCSAPPRPEPRRDGPRCQ